VSRESVHSVPWDPFRSMPRVAPIHGLHRVGLPCPAVAVNVAVIQTAEGSSTAGAIRRKTERCEDGRDWRHAPRFRFRMSPPARAEAAPQGAPDPKRSTRAAACGWRRCPSVCAAAPGRCRPLVAFGPDCQPCSWSSRDSVLCAPEDCPISSDVGRSILDGCKERPHLRSRQAGHQDIRAGSPT
jgi:hypothetical protein